MTISACTCKACLFFSHSFNIALFVISRKSAKVEICINCFIPICSQAMPFLLCQHSLLFSIYHAIPFLKTGRTTNKRETKCYYCGMIIQNCSHQWKTWYLGVIVLYTFPYFATKVDQKPVSSIFWWQYLFMFWCSLLKTIIYLGQIKGQINKNLWTATHFGISRKKVLNCTKKGVARENTGVTNSKGVNVKE